MAKKIASGVLVAVCGIAVGVAFADPVDNPGDARFWNDTGSYPIMRFASTEWINGSTEEIELYVEGDGDVFFNGATMPFNATSQTVGGGGGAAIEAQLFVTDITGIIDLSSGTFFDWEVTAQARFRATAAGVTSSNCRTASFSFTVDGDWLNHAVSDAFTIPALSGTGTGACNGHSTEINLDFALGSSGAYYDLHKWQAENIASGDPLEGS